MALATTTLSSAVAINDSSIVVASATSMTAGRLIRVDDEWMKVQSSYASGTTIPVLRGQQGSAVLAHASSANVTHGLASDFTNAPAQASQGVTVPSQHARRIASYSASGAITLPSSGEDAVAILNGTSALAMTVAVPTKDLDGSILYITGNGKSASTVTFASGIGLAGTSYDVATFQNAGQIGISVIAANGSWNLLNGPITGTSTALSFAIA
jgi:hypothetical protein